ncbi:MAG: translation initiation factor IF-2 [Planctomycetota bacterium]|nr:MAG: translation initiation factor IF-2 [Planctomycetota bacterium]
MRVREFAKEFNVTPKEIIALLEADGITGKVPASSMPEDSIKPIREKVTSPDYAPLVEPRKSRSRSRKAKKPEGPATLELFDEDEPPPPPPPKPKKKKPKKEKKKPAAAATAVAEAPPGKKTVSAEPGKAAAAAGTVEAPPGEAAAEAAKADVATVKKVEKQKKKTKKKPKTVERDLMPERVIPTIVFRPPRPEKPVEEKPKRKKKDKAIDKSAEKIETHRVARIPDFKQGPRESTEKTSAPAKGRRRERERFSRAQIADRHDRGRGPRRRQKFVMKRSAPVIEFKRPEELEISLPLTLKDLCPKIGIKANEIIRDYMMQGMFMTINDYLDELQVLEIGEKYGVDINITKARDEEDALAEYLKSFTRDPANKIPRNPIITLLGHVDHGKTTLLERFLDVTGLAAAEAGGITQHISAFYLEHSEGDITFVDTPGHAAFSEMRARGANVTDLVVLVVAVDDGVMEQTKEAIAHAREANVPIIVALNKVDKANANVMRTKQQLAGLGLSPPDWGGNTEMIEVSALKGGDEIKTLLETIVLETQIMELTADPTIPAVGTVLDAHLDSEVGVVASVLISEGTLHRSDIALAGPGFGKVRAMMDVGGKPIEEAGPSMPARMLGLSAVPSAGDRLNVCPNLETAKRTAENRQKRARESQLAKRKRHITLEGLFGAIEAGKIEELNLVLKADVQGSLEVLTKEFSELSTDEVRVRIIHSGVGGINHADVALADASNAIVIGFHVVPDDAARGYSEEHGVEMRLYQVIYHATSELKDALEGLLKPEIEEVVAGHIEIRQVFQASKIGNIAGCYVKDGKVARNHRVRLIRDSVIIYDGEIQTLRRFKDDVKEVQTGYECGLKIKNYDDIKTNDIIESYYTREIARTIEV